MTGAVPKAAKAAFLGPRTGAAAILFSGEPKFERVDRQQHEKKNYDNRRDKEGGRQQHRDRERDGRDWG